MKFLIVDDEETVVDFFSQAAKAMGHTDIETASTGEEALTRVIQNTYDLITLDIRMPGVSGLEVLSPIRNMCPHAIIAVISGHISDDFDTDLAGCADVVIRKPVDLSKLNKLLEIATRICETIKEVHELEDVPNRN